MELSEALSPQEIAEINGIGLDIGSLDTAAIVSAELFDALYAVPDALERNKYITLLAERARTLKCISAFNKAHKLYLRELGAGSDAVNESSFTEQPLILTTGKWVADDGGVYVYKQQPDGSTTRDYASPIPIMPTALLVNADSGTEKICLAYYKHYRWQNIICDRSVVANNAAIVGLSDQGVEVTSDTAKKLVKYLSDCVNLNRSMPVQRSITRLGWLDGDFVPYADNIHFDGDAQERTLYEAITTAGSYEKWRDYTFELRKNMTVRLTMAAAFAAPLIKQCNALSFIFHLWGTTGGGKTVAAMVGASIWGNPAQGKLTRTMNATINALADTAAFMQNLPLIGDELQTVKTAFGYDKLIMTLCEGNERGRLGSDSKQRNGRTWLTSFIFTGEEPITASNSGGGVKNRCIEVNVKDQIITDGNETVNFITQNYGEAGRRYIEAVKAYDTANITGLFKIFQRDILEAVKTTEKQAAIGALLLAADWFATTFIYNSKGGFLGVEDIVPYMVLNDEIDAAERAYNFIVNHIAAHKLNFDASEHPAEFWGKIEDREGGETVMINKTILERELKLNGFDYEAVKSKWAAKNRIIRNSQDKLYHQTKVSGIKATYIKIFIPSDDDKAEISSPPFA